MLTRYLIALLADLIVINLFAEFWSRVSIDGFSTSLIAAVLLQLLLQATLALEHRVGGWFDQRSGNLWRFLRYFSAWFILFGSKFVMLGAVDRVLGDSIHFGGAMHGVLAFIAVVAGMLIAEELVTRVYRRLA
ncbi:hypothetical protein R0135_00280 [Congregibacter variabilis]|uniref:Uncharacterized protein n=1 Tax=Congregibacter variabilis TaxID=3081200 RepID=A0ABZ0I4T5_9GAMM|nr:hypothetical protein R0135_00280 [Congregibacter sp. IMCC43200]